MTSQQAQELVDKATMELGEQFEAVQILVTWPDQEGTKNLYQGCGYWFARRGMVQDFMSIDAARDNARMIADSLRTDDD